ncbi:MAG: hypothetical protein ABIG66_04085 [Candidatus Kerfeldbacteria bacterium]
MEYSNASLSISSRVLPGVIAYICFFAAATLACALYFSMKGQLFSSGILYYQISAFLDWFTPSITYLFIGCSCIIAASAVYASLLRLGADSWLSWTFGILYALAPVMMQDAFSLPASMFFMIGFPVSFFLIISAIHSWYGIAFSIIWAMAWTIVLPVGGVALILTIASGYWWFDLVLSDQKGTRLNRFFTTVSLVGSYIVFIVLAIMLSRFVAPVLERFNINAYDRLIEVAKHASVDFSWALDFPLSALFSIYFPVEPTSVPEYSIPAFAMLLALALYAWLSKKYISGIFSRAMLVWTGLVSLLCLVVSLGPLLKFGSQIVEPYIPLPGAFLIWFSSFEKAPYYFILPALFFALLAAGMLISSYVRKHQYKYFTAVITVGFIFFIGQYATGAVPRTYLYMGQDYSGITERPQSTQVFEIHSGYILESYLRYQRAAQHGQLVVDDSSEFGQQIYHIIATSGVPFIPQQNANATGAILSYYNIHYVDLIKQTVKPGKKKLIDAAENLEAYEAIPFAQLLNSNHAFVPLAKDEYHNLYAVQFSELPEAHISFTQTSPPTARVKIDESSEAQEFKYIQFISGGKLNYMNFTQDRQQAEVRINYSSKRFIQLHVMFDNQLVKMFTIPKKTNNAQLEFTLENIEPGEHSIEFVILKRKGAVLDNINTKSGLRVRSLEYSLD